MSQNSDLEEDFLPAENDDVYDPAESVISHMIRTKRLIFLTRTFLRTVRTIALNRDSLETSGENVHNESLVLRIILGES